MAEPIIRPATTSEKLGNINYGDVVRSVLHGFLLGSPGGPTGSLIIGLGAGAETAFPGAGNDPNLQMGMIPTSKNIKEFLGQMAGKLGSSLAESSSSNTKLSNSDIIDLAKSYIQTRYPNRANLAEIKPGYSTAYGNYDPETKTIELNPESSFSPYLGRNIETLGHETQHAVQNARLNSVPSPTYWEQNPETLNWEVNHAKWKSDPLEIEANKAGVTARKGFYKFTKNLAEQFPDTFEQFNGKPMSLQPELFVNLLKQHLANLTGGNSK